MQYKALLAAVIALPLLLLACDRSEQSPTAANPSQERQATTPDSTIEKSPPAAGTPSPADVSANPAAPSSSTPADNPPASSPSQPNRSGQ